VFAFEATDTLSFNLNCSAFEYDGGDCELDCHQSIYWATDFVQLGDAYQRIDECSVGEPYTTTWTTACDCYDFCSGYASSGSENFLFDHDNHGQCRCWFDLGNGAWTGEPQLSLLDDSNTQFCGLNSECQIYQPNREMSCSGIDYTLGVYDGGMAFDEDSMASEVTSFDQWTSGTCVDDAMCEANSYSQGSCFDCGRFSTDEQQDSYCTNEGDYFAQISNTDLDTLIADGYLMGSEAEDISTGGDNCACLNYCFSVAIESGLYDSADDFYESLNIIAQIDAAYATRNETCTCFNDCAETSSCGTVAGDCTTDAIIWHSTVADLNTQ